MSQAEGITSTREQLPDRSAKLLGFGRLLACVFMLACGLVFIAGMMLYPAYATTHPEQFLTWNWTVTEMETIFSRVGLSFYWWLQFNLVVSILFAAFQGIIGFMIFLKKRDDWFSLYVGTVFIFFGTMSSQAPGIVADVFPIFGPVLDPMGVYAWVSLFLIFFAFPDGRFFPRWMAWVAGLLVVGYTYDILYFNGETPPPPLLILLFTLIGMGVANQVYRYRRVSTPSQRQQTKWVIFALLVVFAILITIALPALVGGPPDPVSTTALVLILISSATSFIIGLIPLSIAVAILRYRLWDIDLIIRRTLIYGALTATLGLIYFGGVVLMQGIFPALTGERRSEVVIVITTLTIAALFTPLRKRIQNNIDRRFYRKKYSAEQTLSSFAVMARQETDLDTLSGNLMRMVEETIHPESLSLWLIKEEAMGMKYT